MFCGIDVGTQGVRAAVIDDDGRVIGEGAAATPAGRRDKSRHTQQSADWWAALTSAVRQAVDSAAEVAGSPAIDAVAVDGTSGTVLVEDRDGTPAGPALMYDDGRAVAEAVEVQAAGAELWSALGYRMQPSWALPKVLWLTRHGGVRSGQRIVHQTDHLVGRLAGGAVATDTSTALKTGADLRDATWPADVLSALGLSTSLLPALVTPGTVIGHVGRDAAAETGLRQGVPIRAGMTDGCAAQIAAGALQPGDWSSALGTTLVVKGSTRELIIDPSGAVYSHRHPDGGWLPGGASSTGAGAIAAAFPAADAARLQALTRAAAPLVPVNAVVYPLTGQGERFPFVAPAARGFGPDLEDAPRFAALCQAIAYLERLCYDVLGVLGADIAGTVSLTGGATANGWWNQLRTDVLGRPTRIPASAQAAVGMAVLAAAEPGQLATTADRMIRIDHELTPDQDRGQALRDGYHDLVGALAERGWLDARVAGAVTAQSSVAR